MNIASDTIGFDNILEFSNFVHNLNLAGYIMLKEPLYDKNKNILIKDNITVTPNILNKLFSMGDLNNQTIHILISNDLVKKINLFLTDKILEILEDPNSLFISHLYDNTPHNYKSYIANSLRYKKLSMALYQIYLNQKPLFNHLASLGLLSLGTIMRKNLRIRMIHRYSFLAGIAADLGLASGSSWKLVIEDDLSRKKSIENCADYAEALRLPTGISAAIRNHFVSIKRPLVKKEDDIIRNIEAKHSAEELSEDEKKDLIGDIMAGPLYDDNAPEELDEETQIIVCETLKIARFIHDITKTAMESDNFAEELVYMLAYNAAHGYFYEELVKPILKKFKDFEKIAKVLIEIAYVERKCQFPPSAWAYPKPRSTQILCRNSIQGCPKIEKGWDIHVISPHDAFGRLGDSLPAGNYPKCRLEEELFKIKELRDL